MKNTVVLCPTPGAGHLVSTIELAKRLANHANNSLSIAILLIRLSSGSSLAFTSEVSSHLDAVAASGLDIVFIDLPELPADQGEGSILNHFQQIGKHKDSIAKTLSAMKSTTTISAFVVDMFRASMITVSSELNIPTFVFFTSGAAAMANFLYFPTLTDSYECDLKDLKEDLRVPGLPPIPPTALPSVMQEKNSPISQWFAETARSYSSADGILVNTFLQLQPLAIEALTEGLCCPDARTPPLYPVGPLIHLDAVTTATGSGEHECIKWLNQHPPSSVVFLCFGSAGSFSVDRIHEIARGLELSGHRFLWSVRVKPATADQSAPLDGGDIDAVLPQGFVERVGDRGLVWPKWAPQIPILSHPTVGGFVSHCGWNSTLESMWFGVPMIAWPLYAEQGLNAVELVTQLGVAVGLKREAVETAPGGGGLMVRAEELEKSVRELMDGPVGKKAREKMKEASELARKAVEPRCRLREAISDTASCEKASLSRSSLVRSLSAFLLLDDSCVGLW